MKLQQRMERLVNAVCEGMFEREEVISVALLGALCGQNTFLYGPPGTAKSLISRRIACAFANPAYFEYLMNRFSTPEVSIHRNSIDTGKMRRSSLDPTFLLA